MPLDPRASRVLIVSIGETLRHARRVLNEQARDNAPPEKEALLDPKFPPAEIFDGKPPVPLTVLLISEQNELRVLEGNIRDAACDLWQGDGNHVIHVNSRDLTERITRGNTLVGLVISKRLWAGLPDEYAKDLHNSLLTVAYTLGIPVPDLVHFV